MNVSPFCEEKPFYSKFVSVSNKNVNLVPVFRYSCDIEWNDKVNIAQLIVIRAKINCILSCSMLFLIDGISNKFNVKYEASGKQHGGVDACLPFPWPQLLEKLFLKI